MAGSMAKDICDSWADIQNECCGVVGMKVGLRMMIAMLDTSGMCD
jgi:hypothetical protein